MIGIGRTISPIGLDHGLYDGFGGIVIGGVMLLDAIQITIQEGAAILFRNKQGIPAREDGIPAIGSNSINVQPPTPCQGSSTPPRIVVGMHAYPPPGKPMVQMKVR